MSSPTVAQLLETLKSRTERIIADIDINFYPTYSMAVIRKSLQSGHFDSFAEAYVIIMNMEFKYDSTLPITDYDKRLYKKILLNKFFPFVLFIYKN